MPLFCLMYLIAYIDRQNVSYAKLDMVHALGLTEAAYGLGASLFFIGYFLFEAPSNLILARVGARVWFARIMFTWGLVTLAWASPRTRRCSTSCASCWGSPRPGSSPGCCTS
jgi:sugar phosphate permease